MTSQRLPVGGALRVEYPVAVPLAAGAMAGVEIVDRGPVTCAHASRRRAAGAVSIGGIHATDDRDDVTRVPLLGKIPLWGAFFRHRAHRDPRSERVVFITPPVVQTNWARAAAAARRLDKAVALPVSCGTNHTGLARGHRCKRGTHTPMYFL